MAGVMLLHCCETIHGPVEIMAPEIRGPDKSSLPVAWTHWGSWAKRNLDILQAVLCSNIAHSAASSAIRVERLISWVDGFESMRAGGD